MSHSSHEDHSRPAEGVQSPRPRAEIRTLHDAADRLEPLVAEALRIVDDAALLERAHHLAVADAGAVVEGLTDDETEVATAEASGWRRYFDAVWALAELLGQVEGRRWDVLHAEVPAFAVTEDER
jgi:hypothetical protein